MPGLKHSQLTILRDRRNRLRDEMSAKLIRIEQESARYKDMCDRLMKTTLAIAALESSLPNVRKTT